MRTQLKVKLEHCAKESEEAFLQQQSYGHIEHEKPRGSK